MEKLINALLTQENGISEEAFNALYEYLEELSDMDDNPSAYGIRTNARAMLDTLKRADATDGRFYFAE